MSTAIIYVSQHGTTAEVAKMISEKLMDTHVDLIDLKKIKKPDLQKYDRIIIGGSIHAGKIQNNIRKFCKYYFHLLTSKTIGLFVCGMEPNEEKQKMELEKAYPLELKQYATAIAFLGGEFMFEKMNFFEKWIIKKIAKTDQNVSAINYKAIDEFVKKMKI